jgi:hypothetical protein
MLHDSGHSQPHGFVRLLGAVIWVVCIQGSLFKTGLVGLVICPSKQRQFVLSFLHPRTFGMMGYDLKNLCLIQLLLFRCA